MTAASQPLVGGMTLKRTKVTHLTKDQARYTRGADGLLHSNAMPVYARREADKPTVISTIPGGHFTSSMTDDELAVARTTAKKYGWTLIETPADIVIPPKKRWEHLDGDLDCHTDLLDALELVGRDLGVVVLVRSGRRTIEEQWSLWNANMHHVNGVWVPRPGHALTAYPSLRAPHVLGVAADCGINGVNIGGYPNARPAMLKHGIALPVVSENWHAELGGRERWAPNWLPKGA